MKTLLFGLILISLLSCSDDDIAIRSLRDDSSITSLNGTWKVISFEDHVSNNVEHKNQENSWNMDIVITFNDTKSPREFSGKNTTNSIFGEFEYVHGRQFRLQRLGTTMVNQPRWADEFAKAVLDPENSFEINVNLLRIYYEAEQKSVTLQKQ